MVLCIALACGLEGCGSRRTVARGSQGKVSSTGKGGGKTSPRRDNLIILQRFPSDVSSGFGDAMVSEARKWIGVPYKYGGADKQGADCSGLVMEVVREVAQTPIPRNSRAQQRYCSEVTIPQIQVGDLVFFSADHSPEGITHVGIYCGSGRMIHASSSRGVVESEVDKGYWAERFCCVGRPLGAIERWQSLHSTSNPPASPKSPNPPILPINPTFSNSPTSPNPSNSPNSPNPPNSPNSPTPSDDPVQAIELLDLLLDQKLDSIVGAGF